MFQRSSTLIFTEYWQGMMRNVDIYIVVWANNFLKPLSKGRTIDRKNKNMNMIHMIAVITMEDELAHEQEL